MINYEYQDADNTGPTIIPEGQYEVRVTGHEFGMSRSGTDSLTLDLHFEDLDCTLKSPIYFTAKSAWKFDTVLKCFCADKLPSKGDAITLNKEFIDQRLMNKVGRVEVVKDVYQDRERSIIGKYLPATSLGSGAGSGQQTMIQNEDKGDVNVPV